MQEQPLYFEPLKIFDKSQCFFYHTVDLKTGETVYGNWDIRGREDAYFGGVAFSGKRALDVGCATGFLTFAMEDRGAEVTSLDLGPGATMSRDHVPFADHNYLARVREENMARRLKQRLQLEPQKGSRADQKAQENVLEDAVSRRSSPRTEESLIDSPYAKIKRISDQHRGYFYCHTANRSRAKVVYRSVYEMPRQMGPFDVSMFGAILLHLRDPFFALHNGCRLTKETVIVTDVLHASLKEKTRDPVMRFVPTSKDKSRIGTFWMLSPEIVAQMLGVLGFEDSTITYHNQIARGAEKEMFTVVAHRTAPFNPEMTY